MKILLVEDNLLVGLDLKAKLLDLGCEVLGPMATVAQALEAIRTEALDGALLDFRLRDETSVAIAEALQQMSCPLCFLTGFSKPLDLPVALQCVPRLDKPVTTRSLRTAVEEFGAPDIEFDQSLPDRE